MMQIQGYLNIPGTVKSKIPFGVKKRLKLLIRDPYKFLQKAYKIFRPMRKDYRSRLSMPLSEYLQYHQTYISNKEKCTWQGVCMRKPPSDAWILQEIVYEVKPDIIVEIGSYQGGSTLYLADLLGLIGNGKIISIDIDRTHYKAKHDRIIEITGDSSSPEVVSKVSDNCHGKSVLVIQDGDHSKEQVLKDLNAYWQLVSIGSYFIVEDGVIDLIAPGDFSSPYYDKGGPLLAIEEFLGKNSNFVVDSERERYILTYHPLGYLKRVR